MLQAEACGRGVLLALPDDSAIVVGSVRERYSKVFYSGVVVSCGVGENWQPYACACRRTNLRTKAEPQQIVAQRLLSCLQYPVP